jgi:RNA polymerase sigma-70 factor (ECF subfamily)
MDGDKRNIDSYLLKAFKESDENAFEELFQKYYDPLCHYCEAVLNDCALAEDIVQDVFVYLLSYRDKIEVWGEIKVYLFSAVKRRALDVLKHQVVERNHSALLTDFLKDLSTTDYSEEEAEKLEKIKLILEELPSQCRLVFTLSCLDGKKYKEIAEELGISVNTVKSHVKKAYQYIRENVFSGEE